MANLFRAATLAMLIKKILYLTQCPINGNIIHETYFPPCPPMIISNISSLQKLLIVGKGGSFKILPPATR